MNNRVGTVGIDAHAEPHERIARRANVAPRIEVRDAKRAAGRGTGDERPVRD